MFNHPLPEVSMENSYQNENEDMSFLLREINQHNVQQEITPKKSSKKLQNYRNFVVQNIVISLTFLFDNISFYSNCLLIISYYPDAHPSQKTLLYYYFITNAFAVGFGAQITSRLSKLLINNKIHLAKKCCFTYCMSIFTFG